MIQKNELVSLIEKAELIAFETEMSFDDDIPNRVYLRNKDISEVIKFAQAIKSTIILYCYNHYDKNEFCIDEDMLSEHDDRLIKAVSKDVAEHNQRIDKLDFTRPMRLYVYCIYQGCSVTFEDEDYWVEDMDIMTAEEKLDELFEAHNDIFEEITAQRKNEKESLKINLKELILADPHFYECTNQKLRRTYVLELLQKKTEFSKAFSYYIEPIEFVEFIVSSQVKCTFFRHKVYTSINLEL